MSTAYSGGRSAVFEQLRRRLFSIAYRMIGMRADAEDIVQEAYIRWHQANADEVRSPEAWLVSVVTRLSIDRLRKASAEREKYTGPWLPEPLFGSTSPSPQEELELASDLSMAFMVLLERLAPVERAAFLLHDVFDCAYPATQFSEDELVNLTLAVVTINGWNRLNIAFRTTPASYQPRRRVRRDLALLLQGD